MNDKCAAGTGVSVKYGTGADLNIEQLGPHALEASGKGVVLSSMCTVLCGIGGRFFNRTGKRTATALPWVFTSLLVNRVCAVVRRVGYHPRFVFAGGWHSIPACVS